MVLSAVSELLFFVLFQADDNTDDSADAGREKKRLYASLRHVDAFRSRMKTDRGNCTARLISPNRNGTARCLAVSTHAFGPVHSEKWGLGSGGGVLAVKVCTVFAFGM